MLNIEKIFESLKTKGCICLIKTGSSVNPYIQHPRDVEYYAIFNTLAEAKSAQVIPGIIKIAKDYIPKHWYIWGYLHHYINETDEFLGEKVTLNEPSLEVLNKIADSFYTKASKNVAIKYWYHYLMVKAITRYGYDNIPENIVSIINDLHDMKNPYNAYEEQLKGLI